MLNKAHFAYFTLSQYYLPTYVLTSELNDLFMAGSLYFDELEIRENFILGSC